MKDKYYRGIHWEYYEDEYDSYFYGTYHGYHIWIDGIDNWFARIEWGPDNECNAFLHEDEIGPCTNFQEAVDAAIERIESYDPDEEGKK